MARALPLYVMKPKYTWVRTSMSIEVLMAEGVRDLLREVLPTVDMIFSIPGCPSMRPMEEFIELVSILATLAFVSVLIA